jgi:hypothetical protein
LRAKIARFSGEVSAGLGAVGRRFIAEMLYGIEASGSVMLTKIARTLEEPIALKKTHERLSRNLGRKEIEEVLTHNLLERAARRIEDDTLLVLDPGDLSKKYAEKMEYLCRVHDGSEGDVTDGYPLLHIIGCSLESKEIIPLYQRLFSYTAPEFESENTELLAAIDAVRRHVGNRGIWVIDRGGDRNKLFYPLLEREARFSIRLRGDRHLLVGNRCLLALEIAASCACPYAASMSKMENGVEKHFSIEFGFRGVKLPQHKRQLYLLVVKGFGAEPLMVLTTEKLGRSYKVLYRMLQSYLRRWAIEETIRFIKGCYDLEDVRVLRYIGLQNLMPLVLSALYFSAVVLDGEEKLRLLTGHVLSAAKRVFGIPEFLYYALADGLKSIFARHPGRPHRISRHPPDPQLSLL